MQLNNISDLNKNSEANRVSIWLIGLKPEDVIMADQMLSSSWWGSCSRLACSFTSSLW